MKSIDGVVIGIVTDVNDPDKLGRVRVEFPWLSDSNQTPWVRIATFMSGKARGSWFMPEVDDEALVAFDHGNIDHPYIIGFLWNGVDKPPNDDISTEVRRLRTVSGHVIEFDDRPGQERILIKTPAGNQMEYTDAPSAITIKTQMGNSITITDAPPGISIEAKTGTVEINCLKANVTAKTLVDVTVPLAQFSGIVKVPLLQAEAIVTKAISSLAYTPGAGNLI